MQDAQQQIGRPLRVVREHQVTIPLERAVDPKVATPAEIAKMRAIQTGHQVDGITGGLEVKDQK